MEKSQVVHVRVADSGLNWVDEIAYKLGVSRSLVLRAMFKVARQHHAEVEDVLTEHKQVTL